MPLDRFIRAPHNRPAQTSAGAESPPAREQESTTNRSTDQPINGPTDQPRNRPTAGITLIELLVVMAIVAAMMAIAYPNVTSGLEGIRIKSVASDIRTFWSEARQRADRFQEVVQVTIDTDKHELRARSAESEWKALIPIDANMAIAFPEEPQSWILYPGVPSPEFALALVGQTGSKAGIKVNVLTGVPEDWDGEESP